MPPLHTLVIIKSFGCSDLGYWDGVNWYFKDGTAVRLDLLDGLEWEKLKTK